jgi:poly(3-hydroxybutyrate) depolymerase
VVGTDNIWSNLFEDVQQRLTFDRHRIYVCGFSGGAKVAGYIALRHPEIKSVIANGAGLPEGTSMGILISVLRPLQVKAT